MAAKNYSTDFKNKVLSYLRDNGYSYYQTAKKFKVSINTIKSWDNYPHNLPAEAKLRTELNRLKRSKTNPIELSNTIMNSSMPIDIPDDINLIKSIAVKNALIKGLFLLDYTYNTKEYLEVVKAISDLIRLPEFKQASSGKSIVDELMRKYSIDNKSLNKQNEKK